MTQTAGISSRRAGAAKKKAGRNKRYGSSQRKRKHDTLSGWQIHPHLHVVPTLDGLHALAHMVVFAGVLLWHGILATIETPDVKQPMVVGHLARNQSM